MKTDSVLCDRCARGCEVRWTQEDGKYYINGNNCVGGELTAKDTWSFLEGKELHKNTSEKRTGVLSKLFGKLNKKKA